ncbi:MAG TPA: hypothetical protein DD409_05950 [Bacteroidales bacterium]|nr:hypothetical protein [Bacteroidales bacterium]
MNTQELEILFDILIKSSTTCSILVDLNGTIIRFNEAYRQLIGYTDEEIRGKDFTVYESEAVYQREIGFMNELLKGKRSDIKYESTRLTKDGRIIPVEVTALLFTDKNGQAEFALKRIEDISTRVQSEEISRNQMFFLNTLLEEVPLSIYFKDKKSRFLLNSKEHLALLGETSMNALRGKTDFDYFAPEHAQKALNDEQHIMETGHTINVVEKIIDMNGKVRWGQTIKNVLKDQNGEVLGTFGITRDITELKEAQDALEAANLDLHAKNKQLEVAIDELGHTQNKLVFAEKMAALGSLIGGIAHEINTPLGAIKASSGNIMEVVEKINHDLPWLIEHATPLETHWLFKLLSEADARDISVFSKEERQQKRVLSELLETNGIENAQVVADTIVSLKLHYTNDTYLSLLKQPNAQRLLQILKVLFSLKRNTNNIAVSVEKASNVVKALKSYIYKNATGEFETVDLTETINTVLVLTANMIKHSKTEVITKFSSIPPVKCQQDEICQVWTNIITNAVQAMGEGGKLEIALTYQKEKGSVLATFSDNGPGMPETIRNRVFEPFFTTKPKGQGTGMGLDISHQIIERHNGRIDVTSSPGEGTTFFIELPLIP